MTNHPDLVHQHGGSPPVPTPEEQANLDLIRRFRSLPVDQRRSLLAPGFVRHRAGAVTLHQRGAYDPTGIPDRTDHILAMVARGDVVWAVWRITGTHSGTLFGTAPTGAAVDVLEVGIWRVEQGLIAEAWFLADELTWAQQLGILPGGEATP